MGRINGYKKVKYRYEYDKRIYFGYNKEDVFRQLDKKIKYNQIKDIRKLK